MIDETRAVERQDWHAQVAQAQRDGFTFFDLLTAVDHEEAGLEVLVRLWDPVVHRGLLLRTRCAPGDAHVPTLTDVFAGAAWHERATAELFGITFDGHDTAPLLLSPAFPGHPLRKDFVLAARVAKPWPGAKDPGESDADLQTGRRRRPQPPGVPAGWGSP